MNVHDVIRRPLVTEKSNIGREEVNLVTFAVDTRASKHDIRRAVEELFDVQVMDVHVVNRKGKPVMRYGRVVNHRKAARKAYVKLTPGSKKLEFFEGV